jgi:hypothetical protein
MWSLWTSLPNPRIVLVQPIIESAKPPTNMHKTAKRSIKHLLNQEKDTIDRGNGHLPVAIRGILHFFAAAFDILASAVHGVAAEHGKTQAAQNDQHHQYLEHLGSPK